MKKQLVRADFSALGAVATNIETMSNILMCNTQAKKTLKQKKKGEKTPLSKNNRQISQRPYALDGAFFRYRIDGQERRDQRRDNRYRKHHEY